MLRITHRFATQNRFFEPLTAESLQAVIDCNSFKIGFLRRLQT